MTKKREGDQAVPAYPDSLGANIHSGGEQDIGAPVPPYEGRQTSGKTKEQLIEEGARSDHFAGSRNVTQTEQQGMGSADPNPVDPHGVGDSTTPGNEQSLGMSEDERRAARLETDAGVGPHELKDPSSPNMQPGDQGG